MAQPNLKPVPLGDVPPPEDFFTEGFDYAYEAETGALDEFGAQCTDGVDIQTFVNQGAKGAGFDLEASAPAQRPVYLAGKIDGHGALHGDGSVNMLHATIGALINMDQDAFSLLLRMRFDVRAFAQASFWPRHHAGQGASYIEYSWTNDTLFFRNLQQGGGSNDITLGLVDPVPEDVDLTVGLIFAGGTITAYHIDAANVVVESAALAHIADGWVNDQGGLIFTSPEINIAKLIMWNGIDITADLERNAGALLNLGFPTS